MEAHLRQQFDVLLASACESFTERIVQRCAGGAAALEALQSNPEGEGVWLSEFVEAVFRENLLDSPDGALFVLGALARRPVASSWAAGVASGGAAAPSRTVAQTVESLARSVFSELLRLKVQEQLGRSLSYG